MGERPSAERRELPLIADMSTCRLPRMTEALLVSPVIRGPLTAEDLKPERRRAGVCENLNLVHSHSASSMSTTGRRCSLPYLSETDAETSGVRGQGTVLLTDMEYTPVYGVEEPRTKAGDNEYDRDNNNEHEYHLEHSVLYIL